MTRTELTSDQVKQGHWGWLYGGCVWHWILGDYTLCGRHDIVEHSSRDLMRQRRRCPRCVDRLRRMQSD
jgi:hypothetical protein